MSRSDLRGAVAELLGTLLVTVGVIGSGIAASRLTGDPGLALLINALATVAVLGASIVAFAPVSGSYFNPVIAIADVAFGLRPARWLAWTIPAQLGGAVGGAAAAGLLFGERFPVGSVLDRLTPATFASECGATAVLVVLVLALTRSGRASSIGPVVAAFVFAAFFATPSTGFMNPALTVGRILTDSATGLAPTSAVGYVAAQLLGGAIGCGIARLLVPRSGVPSTGV